MGMPIRRWELVVDRQRVSSPVLGDEDTQAEYPVVLQFDGRVYNKEKRVAFRGTEASRGRFARLGGAEVGFQLHTEANGTDHVFMISPDTRLYRQDEDDELPVMIPAVTWQRLEWGRDYRMYHVSEDPESEELVFQSMLMWVERCRVPLAQLNRSLRRITGEASPP
jgi:hypothetical protein